MPLHFWSRRRMRKRSVVRAAQRAAQYLGDLPDEGQIARDNLLGGKDDGSQPHHRPGHQGCHGRPTGARASGRAPDPAGNISPIAAAVSRRARLSTSSQLASMSSA